MNGNGKIKIVLIGAGRVGYHLGRQFFAREHQILQVFSRDLNKAQKLSQIIDSQPINSFKKLNKEAELYILAVTDDAIIDVVQKLSKVLYPTAFIVHTSGATPSTVFQPLFKNFGIFYPLQTFSFEKEPDFPTIPICIFANQNEKISLLRRIAEGLSNNVQLVKDEQRAVLHLAAVFVNNFSNYMAFIAGKILEKENLSLEMLLPLFEETVNKLKNNTPQEMQTGPAVRGDKKTIEKHLNLLNEYPEYQKIYEMLSSIIQKQST